MPKAFTCELVLALLAGFKKLIPAVLVTISLSADISNFEGSYPGIFKWVGATNGTDGLSTIVNPVAIPLLSNKPPSLPLKFIIEGNFLTTLGQIKELIEGHNKASWYAPILNVFLFSKLFPQKSLI